MTGPIGAGLRELELIINPHRVYNDYARTGHVAHSYHHCGLAADVYPEQWIWDLIYPWRNHCIELFSGHYWGGLYKRGTRFFSPQLAAEHLTHTHIAINLTVAEVDNYTHVPRNRNRKKLPGAAPPPKPAAPKAPSRPPRTDDLTHSWHRLMVAFGTDWSRWSNQTQAARTDLRREVK